MFEKINLQLFADQNVQVTTQSSMSPTMKTFYDTALLENARENQVFSQLGEKQPLPAGNGNKIEWRKFNTFAKALTPLTEGVNPDGSNFGMTKIEAECTQHGDYTTISDRLELEAYDDVIYGATEEMGAAGGATQDTLTRNVLVAGTSVMYAPKADGTVITSRSKLDGTCLMTRALVKKCVTFLKKNKAPKIDGKYVAIIHPSVAEDLRSDPAWEDVHKYAAVTEIFNGEIGELEGARFIEYNDGKIWRGKDLTAAARNLTVKTAVSSAGNTIAVKEALTAEDIAAIKGRSVLIGGALNKITAAAAGSITVETAITCAADDVIYPGEGGSEGLGVYATLFLGSKAYGVVDPEKAGMEMIIHSKEQAGGPLNMYSTVGYKFKHGAKILYPERMIRVESCSTYSTVDEEN